MMSLAVVVRLQVQCVYSAISLTASNLMGNAFNNVIRTIIVQTTYDHVLHMALEKCVK